MSLSSRVLPAVAAAIAGFGLFGVYSYADHPYADTEARSASKQAMPVFLSDDDEASPAQQPGEATMITSLPALAQSTSSEGKITPTDRWASEALEAASRGSFAPESDGSDEPVGAGDLLHDVFSQDSHLSEDSVSSKGEALPSDPTSPETATTHSQNPIQPSSDQHTWAEPQQESTTVPSPDPSENTDAPSPPPVDTPSPRVNGSDAGVASDKVKRVLLVEDPRVFDGNLAATLKREPDLVVGQTGSPNECRQFADGEERLNVAIVDLFLPDDQGISLIEGLRRSCPHTPLLVLTASLNPHDRERVVQAGADAVLGKDAAPEEIIATLERLSSN